MKNKKIIIHFVIFIIILYFLDKTIFFQYEISKIIIFIIYGILYLLIMNRKIKFFNIQIEEFDEKIRLLENENKILKDNLQDLNEKNNYCKKIFLDISNLNKLFAFIIDNLNKILFIKNSDLEYNLINNKFINKFNLKKEDVIGKLDTDIKIFNQNNWIFKDNETELINGVINIKNRSFEIKERVINVNDKKLILGTGRDITKMKIRENKIDRLLERYKERIVKKNTLNTNFNALINLFNNIHIKSRFDYEQLLINSFDLIYKLMEEADYGSLYVYENGVVRYLKAYGYNIDELNSFKFSSDDFIKENLSEPLIINNSNNSQSEKFTADSTNIQYAMRIPIMRKNQHTGGISIDLEKKYSGYYSEESKHFMQIMAKLVHIVSSFTDAREVKVSYEKNLIKALLNMLELHDEYTNNHSENVADLAVKLGTKLELSKKDLERIYWAGITHDIGKIDIPVDIINKKGRLTEKEYAKVKEHPVIGALALENSKSLADIAKYVRHHHENYDGTGYPDGLKEKEIPYISRILTVVDAWDAMTSKRSYRDPLPTDIAINELINNIGRQFDGKIVYEFLALLESEKRKDYK